MMDIETFTLEIVALTDIKTRRTANLDGEAFPDDRLFSSCSPEKACSPFILLSCPDSGKIYPFDGITEIHNYFSNLFRQVPVITSGCPDRQNSYYASLPIYLKKQF
jgi:hypothetical protein